MRWRLINLTDASMTTAKDVRGNYIITTAPSIAIFSPIHDGPRGCQRYGHQLLIYRTGEGMYACTTGSGAEGAVTPLLTQDAWDEIHSQAVAGKALLGRLPDIIREII